MPVMECLKIVMSCRFAIQGDHIHVRHGKGDIYDAAIVVVESVDCRNKVYEISDLSQITFNAEESRPAL